MSDHSHWGQCVKHVCAHARDLKRAKVRPHVVEELLQSFLEQPPYWPEWRPKLLQLALAAFEEPAR